MRQMKWIGLAAAVLLIAACFFPWVLIPKYNITVSGVSAEGTLYGKPGYFYILLSVIYILLMLVNRRWSQRVNMFLCALNVAWGFRNFISIAACQAGICPEKQPAFYGVPLLPMVMLLAVLLSKPATPKETEEPVITG